MRFFKNNGFTLIELMIVVALIGILSAIAIPNFMNFVCKSKQIEAKKNLGTLRSCEEAYRATYDSYGSDLDKIAFTFSGTSMYTYTFIVKTKSSYTAQAKRTIKEQDDIWTIDQNGVLINTSNACR